MYNTCTYSGGTSSDMGFPCTSLSDNDVSCSQRLFQAVTCVCVCVVLMCASVRVRACRYKNENMTGHTYQHRSSYMCLRIHDTYTCRQLPDRCPTSPASPRLKIGACAPSRSCDMSVAMAEHSARVLTRSALSCTCVRARACVRV